MSKRGIGEGDCEGDHLGGVAESSECGDRSSLHERERDTDDAPGRLRGVEFGGEPEKEIDHGLFEASGHGVHDGAELVVGPSRNDHLEGRRVRGTGHDLPQRLDRSPERPLGGGDLLECGGEPPGLVVEELLDRADDEVMFGRKVVRLGTPRHAGSIGDEAGRRSGVSVLDQAIDGRGEQRALGVSSSFTLRPALVHLVASLIHIPTSWFVNLARSGNERHPKPAT